jgi:hypothetical protein
VPRAGTVTAVTAVTSHCHGSSGPEEARRDERTRRYAHERRDGRNRRDARTP